jgi:uncharacterized protein YfaA (DUF2138 family)
MKYSILKEMLKEDFNDSTIDKLGDVNIEKLLKNGVSVKEIKFKDDYALATLSNGDRYAISLDHAKTLFDKYLKHRKTMDK